MQPPSGQNRTAAKRNYVAKCHPPWENRVRKGVRDIQTALMNMLENSLLDHCEEDGEFFADLYESITRQFGLPEWMGYNAHLQLALEKKDKEESLAILRKMLPAMKKKWNPQHNPLYRYTVVSNSARFSDRLADIFYDELTNNEEYAFIRDDAEFAELISSGQ